MHRHADAAGVALRMFQAMTLDDAGQRVPLVHFNMTLLPFSVGPLPREVQRAVRSAAMNKSWDPKFFLSRQALIRGSLIGLVPPLLTFGPFMLAMQLGMQSIVGRNIFLVLLLMFPITFYIMTKITPLTLTDQIRSTCARAAVFAGHCGSCGYTLPESANTENGLCRCSECGATWGRSKSM